MTNRTTKLLAVAAIAGAIAFGAQAFAETYPTTLDTIKSNETTYLSGSHAKYTLTTTKGSNTHSVKINGTTYYYTPNEGDTNVVTLANTGSVALETTTDESKAVFDISGTYYTYNTTKLPTSAYSLTKTESTNPYAIKIGDKYYEMTLKQTEYGTGANSKAYTIKIPTNKSVTITAKYDTSKSRLSNLTSDVTGGAFVSQSTSFQGGAISNSSKHGYKIVANFIGNYASASSAEGGAIYNYGGTIGDITGYFIGNYTSMKSAGYHTYGGAICNYGGTIGNITGDFINNQASGYSAYGGAIYNTKTIGNITGDFIGNWVKETGSSAEGGAIYNYGVTIGNITGDFIGNYSSSSSTSDYSYSCAGAIYTGYGSAIGDITGDFIGNYTKATTNLAFGGAIDNSSGTIGNITGDFIGNYASGPKARGGAIENIMYGQYGIIGNITGDFIGNWVSSTNDVAYGGAISNSYAGGTIGTIDGNFINNYAKTTSSTAQGGAIYTKDDLTFVANNKTNTFSGNYVQVGEGEKDYQAIYVDSNTAQLTFTANNGKFAFDDNINGVAGYDVVLTGDATGSFDMKNANSAIKNADVTLENITLNLADASKDALSTSTLTANSGTLNLQDNVASNFEISTLTSNASTNYLLDVIMATTATSTADKLVVGSGSTGTITISDLDIDWTNFDASENDYLISVLDTSSSITLALSDALNGRIYNTDDKYYRLGLSGENLLFSKISDSTISDGTITQIKTKSTAIISAGKQYTLHTTKVDGDVTVKINGTTYYFTPGTDDNATDLQNLANTGSIALVAGTSSDYFYTDGTNYYKYDSTKLPESAYKDFVVTSTDPWNYTTKDADSNTVYHQVVIIPDRLGTTGHVTWSSSSTGATGNVVVNLPNSKTQTLYYTYTKPSGWAESSTRGDVSSATIENILYQGANTTGTSGTVQGGALYNTNTDNSSKNITADFIGNYATNTGTTSSARALGGAIGNYATTAATKLGNITGTFIGNYVNSGYYAFGGAIVNYGTSTYQAVIEDITGDFINNYAKSTNSYDYGGAIYNTGTINSITGDFIGNWASSTSSYAFGGAIYNYDGIINSITGDFIGNYASGTYAYGGAICNIGTISNITGDFINNYASGSSEASGGAIFNYYGTIGDITGDFIGNWASGSSLARGGAILNEAATIGNITGDFIGNWASSTSSYAFGGAILNEAATIGNITGDFIGNYISSTAVQTYGGAICNNGGTIGNITGDFIGNYTFSPLSSSKGGAINNSGDSTYIATIGNITGDFIDNYAIGKSGNVTTQETITGAVEEDHIETTNYTFNYDGDVDRYIANDNSGKYILGSDFTTPGNNVTIHQECATQGGAIYTNQNLSFLADGKTNTFSGNYISTDGGTTKDYQAIYVDSNTAQLTFTANNGKFVFDDNINGATGYDVVLTGDANGSFDMKNANSAIKNADVTLSNITLNLADASKDAFATSNLDAQSGIINVQDGAYSDYNIQKLTSNSAVAYAIDIDLTNNISDTLTVGAGSTGTVTIKYITYTPPTPTSVFTVKVLNAQNDAIKLALDSSLTTHDYKVGRTSRAEQDTVLANTDFDTVYHTYSRGGDLYGNLALATTTTTDDSITISIDASKTQWDSTRTITGTMGDTLNLVNTLDTAETKNFNFAAADNLYTSSDNAGETKGTLNVNGVANETSKSTIDFNGHDGFVVTSGNTLNITDTTLTNASGKLITNSGDVTLTNTQDTTYDENIIHLDTADAKLTLNINNGSELKLNNAITGVNGATVNFSGDNSGGALTLNNNLSNMNVSMGNMDLNSINNTINNYDFNKFTLTGDVNMAADVDLANSTMDRITANSYGTHTGNLNIVGMNILSDGTNDSTVVPFADAGLRENVINMVTNAGNGVENPFQSSAFSPLYRYGVGYSNSTGNFTFTKQGVNPAIMAGSVAQQVGMLSTQNQILNYGFHHNNMFMNNPRNLRLTETMRNQYAINDGNNLQYNPGDKGAWFTPYVTFESVPLYGGPTVNNISYGALVGYDSDLKQLSHGWSRVWTGYAGYSGSTMSFDSNDIYQNGGMLGGTLSLYHGNFFNATTVSVGAFNSEAKTMYGTDNSASLMAGIGNRTGYNFEFKEGRYIIQPSLLVAYTFLNTFNYTNAAGIRMDSDPLHAIQIAPALKFIMNTKNGWQPYATVGMMWNIMDQTHFRASSVMLPSTSIKPYVYYGLGVQKQVKDYFTAYGQAMVHNGGRNGVSLTAGFKWMIGKKEDVQKVDAKGNKTSLNTEKHLIK